MDKYDLYYQVAHSQVVEQDARNQQLEFKASASIGLSATLIGLAGFTINTWNNWSILLAIFMLMAFLVAAIAAILILWVRNFYISPKLPEFSKHLTEGVFNDPQLTEWTADAYSVSIDLNEAALDKKPSC